MKLKWYHILLILMGIISCSEEGSDILQDQQTSGHTTVVKTVISTGDEAYLNLKSDYIFNQEELYTYELILPPDHLEELDRDPAAGVYVEGAHIFQGDTISPVGIRYKGSVGGFVGCVSGMPANPLRVPGRQPPLLKIPSRF